jgi:hypothetical protein
MAVSTAAVLAGAAEPESQPSAAPATPGAPSSTEQLPSCAPEAAAAPLPAPTPAPPPPEHRHSRVFAPEEVSLVGGAGVGDYFGSGKTVHTDTGATWDARATFGAHSIVALEAGYVGSVNSIDVPSGSTGTLSSQGVDGALRLQFPTRVQPYVFAGVGYNHMSLDNDANSSITSQFRKNSDDQVTIPAGGGLTGYLGRHKHATVDVRGTYRLIPDNNITIMDTRALHQWSAQARIGYAF